MHTDPSSEAAKAYGGDRQRLADRVEPYYPFLTTKKYGWTSLTWI